MLVFCSCDFFSPVMKGESDLLSINNKLDEIQNKINSINNNLLIIDSTLIANMSEIEDSLSNITNLLFLTLDGDFSIKGNNSDNSPKDINVEDIFYDTFQIKNIFIKSCLIEEKATKMKMRYFLNDTIVINDDNSIFEYTINKISNFEKYIEIYSLNGEQAFKVAVISD
tara:strand:+ start:1173 stop:1679 length:507 start_codon:yes stop_codon:yes gene_type:complete